MKNVKTLNELFIMGQNNEMKNFIENANKEEILTAVETVFEQGLKGTCLKTWEGELEGYGLNLELLLTKVTEDEILETLDNVVFECSGCGWWCGVDEKNDCDGEALCDQCNDENDEDDEY